MHRVTPPPGSESGKGNELRQRAEMILRNMQDEQSPQQEADGKRLLEELHVYHIELEIQNEDLRQTRDQLEKSQQYLRGLFAFAPGGYLVLSDSGVVLDANVTACHYFTLPAELLKGRRLASMVGPDQLFAFNLCLQEARGEAANPQPVEIRFRKKNNLSFWALMALCKQPSPVDDSHVILCSLVDITRQKEAEQLLRDDSKRLETLVANRTEALRQAMIQAEQSADEARTANTLKSEFLATMSHEVRTPMNSIIGMTELVLNSQLTDEQRKFLNIVRTSSQNLLLILNDILDFSRIEAGRITLESIPFNVQGVAQEVMDAFTAQAREKGITLEFTPCPGLAPGYLGDPGRLRQILINLVHNAIKFTEHGRVGVAIAEEPATAAGGTGQESETVLHLWVNDSGPGIPADKQALIFEAFRQLDGSITRRHGGTGLGLAISARLAQLMNGRIWLQSEVGKGSTFHVTLRVGRLASFSQAERMEFLSGAVPAAFSAPRGSGRAPVPSSPRILLVDDVVFNQILVIGIGEAYGWQVTAVNNGKLAVEALEKESFDLVLMDIEMPVMDGIKATGLIRDKERESGGHIPIIATTAHAMSGDRERLLQAGMDDYVVKPISADGLLSTVTKHLRQAGKGGRV